MRAPKTEYGESGGLSDYERKLLKLYRDGDSAIHEAFDWSVRMHKIHSYCVAITASDPELNISTRSMVNRIGDLSAAKHPEGK
jgi:hypothetical protein